ncbi:MAG: tRNA threonylcarbamoyladenosine dehydratase [Rikenellaceae bacterium]|nr:tRNA threonylcarbamoyladenosine dehydratase [Rikenellaceae bacterium]
MEEWLIRSELLLGQKVLEKMKNSRVAVIGLGGVGAYAAEMIARAGIGAMLILDSDVVNPSNKNRQLLALDSTMGKKKVEIMAARLKDINPDIELTVVMEYLTEENVGRLMGGDRIDYIVDAIDTLSPKIALIKHALGKGIPLVSSMGAGAKLDVTKLEITDISKSYNCPLAYMLRKRLRKEGISKGFTVVFSKELPDTDAIVPIEEQNKKSMAGTISYLPASFGLLCAQVVIRHFVESCSESKNY